MLELTKRTTRTIKVMDLNEGDFAEIKHGGKIEIIYIYREVPDGTLSAVSVTSKSSHWSNIKFNTIEVIRVLKEGDILKVVG